MKKIEENKIEYQCPYCDKTFVNKGNLTTHKISYHIEKMSEKELKKYEKKCKYCDFVCYNGGMMKNHLINNHFDKFSEEEKEKIYKERKKKSETMKKINKIHYICPYCNEIFKNKGSLSNHTLKIHNVNVNDIEPEKSKNISDKMIYLNKIKEIDSIWEPINIDDFCDMNTRFPHKCKLCGNIRNILPKHNIKKDKKLTCFCNGGPRTDEENLIFVKEICKEMNYKFIDVFYDIDKNGKKEKKIKFECPKHGTQIINFKRFKKGQRCGYCTSENKLNESSGERRIRLILTKFNISFLQEHRLDYSLLRYDFYLPDYNLLIEFDGIQHFEEVAYFASKEKSKEELNYKQNNDKRKNQLAKEKNINLLRIPYYDFDNILEILIENLNKYGKQELNVEKIDINLINSIKKEIEEEEENVKKERLKNISPKMKNKNKKISEQLSNLDIQKCPYCGKEIKNKGNLNRHIKAKHTQLQ